MSLKRILGVMLASRMAGRGRRGFGIIRIVGVDEARQELGEVSWVSPIARALNGAREGEIVKLFNPSGIEEIEILKIEYL